MGASDQWELVKYLYNQPERTQRRVIQHMKPQFPVINYFNKEIKKRRFMTASAIYKIIKADPALKKRLKHQHKVRSSNVEIINDNYQLSLSWAFYKKQLKSIGKEHLIKKYKLDYAIYSQDELKALSNFVFYNSPPDYEYIVGIDTLYGWRYDIDEDEIVDKISKWVDNTFEPTLDGDPRKFEDTFRLKIREILNWKDTKLEMSTTAEDFCSNIASTGTTGSAFDPLNPADRIVLEDSETNNKVNYQKNKYTKSASLSLKRKLKRLFSKTKQKANVSHKVEFYPKARIIVSSDYDTTLKMRFIDQWLTPWLSGLDLSTLFQNTKQTFQMWKKFAENKDWNIPIDQTAFDHHVTRRMVIIMLEEIKLLIVTKAKNNDELLKVMDNLIFALDGGDVLFKTQKDGTRKWEYKSGILSGWQWTALLDTLANIAEFRIMIDILKSHNIKTKVLQFNAQGDDALVKLDSPAACLALLVAYNQCGFEVHPRKTFISNTHNEYLRKYSKDNEINGYPTRMVTKLLWVYPGDKLPGSEIEKLSSTFSKWKMFAERMRLSKSKLLSILKYEYNALKINMVTASAYLAISKTRGGVGYTDTITNKKITIEGVSKAAKSFRVTNDKGYEEFRLRFGTNQPRELENWFLSLIKVNDPDYLPQHSIVEVKPANEISPLKFNFVQSEQKPQTVRNEAFPPNVIFGKSHELMLEVFPRIDSFVEQARAPKSWVYDYLLGRLDSVTPYVNDMSDEFSSLLYQKYYPSLINSMYYKRNVPDKWDRLNLYAEREFSNYIVSNIKHLPKMF